MKFSLIIPAYNEAPVIIPTLRILCDAFSRVEEDWNIVVVDNASTDNTALAVEQMGNEHVSALKILEKGKGNAIRAGFLHADGDLVGFTDADLSVLPEEIVNAFLSVLNGEADVVVGSRAHPESKLPGREWWRTASSRLLNLAEQLIVGVRISDTQCPLKVMNHKGKEAMLATRERTWFFDMEFLLLAKRLDLNVNVVPVTWNEHRYPERRSKLSMLTDGVLRSVFAMFRIRLRHATPGSSRVPEVAYAEAGVLVEESIDITEAPLSDIVLK